MCIHVLVCVCRCVRVDVCVCMCVSLFLSASFTGLLFLSLPESQLLMLESYFSFNTLVRLFCFDPSDLSNPKTECSLVLLDILFCNKSFALSCTHLCIWNWHVYDFLDLPLPILPVKSVIFIENLYQTISFYLTLFPLILIQPCFHLIHVHR